MLMLIIGCSNGQQQPLCPDYPQLVTIEATDLTGAFEVIV